MNMKQPTDGVGAHHGRNIRNIRIKRNLKQEALAGLVHMTQQNVSRYEGTKVIDDKTLEKFAKALDVTVEDLKTTEDPSPLLVENTNTYSGNDTVTGISQGAYWGNPAFHSTPTINPINKLVEVYERMIQFHVDRNKELETRIAILEKKLG